MRVSQKAVPVKTQRPSSCASHPSGDATTPRGDDTTAPVLKRPRPSVRGRARLIGLLLIFVGLVVSVSPASAVPAWSRRYGFSCGMCHAYPSLQLTATGLDFLRRGHRLKDDKFDKDLTNLLSVHGEWTYTKQENEPAPPFESPDAHFHAGGAISSHFSSYADVTLNGGDLESLMLQFTKEHGDESYFTARIGKISPTIVRNYGNGLMASASTPLVLTDATLADNPFTPARESFGIDVAQRWKGLFVQTGVLNGEDVPGQAAVNDHKDFFASAEFTAPEQPTGVGLYYYRAGYDLGDPEAATLFDRYDRTSVFANFTHDKVRLAGAYAFGKDRVQTLAERKIRGFYVQLDAHPRDWGVPFARYDWVKTEVEGESERTWMVTIGSAFRLFESEITAGRAVLELYRRSEAAVEANGVMMNLLWAF